MGLPAAPLFQTYTRHNSWRAMSSLRTKRMGSTCGRISGGAKTRCKHQTTARGEYVTHMRKFQNRVWNPTDDRRISSRRCKITWHSLDSLVWTFVNDYAGAFEDFNFGDVYLYFCRLPQFTHMRQHSTSGAPSKDRYKARRSSSASR